MEQLPEITGGSLFDFSPDAVVFRITADPAPRLLYCFETKDDGKTVDGGLVGSTDRVRRCERKEELILGVSATSIRRLPTSSNDTGINTAGVKAACDEAVKQINSELEMKV